MPVFFELAGDYTNSDICGGVLSDSRTEIVEVRTNDLWKKIVFYNGCSDFEDEAKVKAIVNLVKDKLQLEYFIEKHLTFEDRE